MKEGVSRELGDMVVTFAFSKAPLDCTESERFRLEREVVRRP
jgi:hypothetical protein